MHHFNAGWKCFIHSTWSWETLSTAERNVGGWNFVSWSLFWVFLDFHVMFCNFCLILVIGFLSSCFLLYLGNLALCSFQVFWFLCHTWFHLLITLAVFHLLIIPQKIISWVFQLFLARPLHVCMLFVGSSGHPCSPVRFHCIESVCVSFSVCSFLVLALVPI